jgi:hypothetical protein
MGSGNLGKPVNADIIGIRWRGKSRVLPGISSIGGPEDSTRAVPGDIRMCIGVYEGLNNPMVFVGEVKGSMEVVGIDRGSAEPVTYFRPRLSPVRGPVKFDSFRIDPCPSNAK